MRVRELIGAESARFAGLAALAILVGAATDRWGYATALALALWGGWHIREFLRFARWSRHPLARPENASAPWREPVERVYRSIAAARRRARTLLTQLQGLTSLSQALPDGAVVIRRNGEIESFNTAAAQLLELVAKDRGNNLVSLTRHPQFSALVAGRVAGDVVELALPNKPARHLEIRRIDIDGQRWLILVRDVTRLNRLLTMRQDFVANVSHELRTPLTVILGYLEALEDPALTPEESRALYDRMRPPAHRMKSLVDGLLLLTRLESSAAPAQEEVKAIDVAAMLDDIVADAELLSAGHHAIHCDADRLLQLRGVPAEIHSAFANLVTNAVRYSPGGGRIDIRWARDAHEARFEVRDSGVGIAPEHLSRITERFYRVDLAGARVRGGTGLGLAITKHVLQRHGARLDVQSRPGEGSRFACLFPLASTVSISQPKEPA